MIAVVLNDRLGKKVCIRTTRGRAHACMLDARKDRDKFRLIERCQETFEGLLGTSTPYRNRPLPQPSSRIQLTIPRSTDQGQVRPGRHGGRPQEDGRGADGHPTRVDSDPEVEPNLQGPHHTRRLRDQRRYESRTLLQLTARVQTPPPTHHTHRHRIIRSESTLVEGDDVDSKSGRLRDQRRHENRTRLHPTESSDLPTISLLPVVVAFPTVLLPTTLVLFTRKHQHPPSSLDRCLLRTRRTYPI